MPLDCQFPLLRQQMTNYPIYNCPFTRDVPSQFFCNPAVFDSDRLDWPSRWLLTMYQSPCTSRLITLIVLGMRSSGHHWCYGCYCQRQTTRQMQVSIKKIGTIHLSLNRYNWIRRSTSGPFILSEHPPPECSNKTIRRRTQAFSSRLCNEHIKRCTWLVRHAQLIDWSMDGDRCDLRGDWWMSLNMPWSGVAFQ